MVLILEDFWNVKDKGRFELVSILDVTLQFG